MKEKTPADGINAAHCNDGISARPAPSSSLSERAILLAADAKRDQMSPSGTFETCRPVLRMSVHRERPEVSGALSK